MSDKPRTEWQELRDSWPPRWEATELGIRQDGLVVLLRGRSDLAAYRYLVGATALDAAVKRAADAEGVLRDIGDPHSHPSADVLKAKARAHLQALSEP